MTKELSSNPDMDVNQPTPNGKLPLIEAVKTKDLAMVDALIQVRKVEVRSEQS